jgi:hypothetical protein
VDHIDGKHLEAAVVQFQVEAYDSHIGYPAAAVAAGQNLVEACDSDIDYLVAAVQHQVEAYDSDTDYLAAEELDSQSPWVGIGDLVHPAAREVVGASTIPQEG